MRDTLWTTDRAPAYDEAGTPTGIGQVTFRSLAPAAVFALLLLNLLSWRTAVYYQGGADPVVVAKAALAVAALGVAALSADGSMFGRLRARTLTIIAFYLLFALVGAAANGTLVASGVQSVRIVVVVLTVAVLVAGHPPTRVLYGFAATTTFAALLLAASGLPELLLGTGPSITRGRLGGVLLPTSPNQLALLCAPGALALVWRLTVGPARLWHLVGLTGLVTVTVLTGSRAGLLGLVLAGLLVALLSPRIPPAVMALLAGSVPALYFLMSFTPVVRDLVVRGDVTTLANLNSRTIAWSAARNLDRSFFATGLGRGISIKEIRVDARHWDTQVLDSSWVSTFVQAGVVGIVLLVLWSVSTLWLSARMRTHYGPVCLGLASYALMRSALENGLLDTYVLFLVALVPALLIDTGPSTAFRSRWEASQHDTPALKGTP